VIGGKENSLYEMHYERMRITIALEGICRVMKGEGTVMSISNRDARAETSTSDHFF